MTPPPDPVTVEVIGAALASIVEEMGEALVRASFSTNIKERRDCSTALFDREGRTLCQAEHIPIHLGSFLDLIPEILRRHDPAGLRPGDVFIGNDAYAGGGTHLPDIVLAEPVFVDGAVAAWCVNLAHHADFADRSNAHIFQEGLRIPPIRLHRAGVLDRDVLDLILLNCQVPRERLSDLRAQMAANRLGVARVQALCGRHGTGTVLAAGAALMDYAERRMRAGIAAIPDGVYRFRDLHDSPEVAEDLPLSVEIAVAGDAMRLHFDGPPQVRAGINMTMTALLATVYYAVKAVVDPDLPPNAGLARPLTVTARPGTVVNCVAPAAVNARLSTCQRVADLILGALAQAVPERLTGAHNGACSVAQFSGYTAGGPWAYLETIGGGFGARATKDGLDGVHVHNTNTSNLPVEALETEYPLTLLAYELVEGSGGAGTWRGGMGLRRVYRAEAECRVRLDTSRLRTPPWGLAGGLPGGRARLEFGPGVAPFGLGGRGGLRAGQWVAVVTAGAGGYGPPEGRAPDRVARDVAEGVITAGEARRAYGTPSPSPPAGEG
jgi:N-methylhydantoinase B